MKKILATFCSFALLTAQAQALDFSNARGKVTLRSIQDTVISMNKGETCLDEYLERDRTLTLRTGLGTGIGVPVGAGVGLGAAVATVPLLLFGGAAFIIPAGVFGGGALAVPVLLSTISGIQLGQNRYVMRLVAQSYNDEGRRLDKFHKRLTRKYRRKASHLNKQDLASMIRKADRSGALCDGTMTGKLGKLKRRLARPKHLIRYLGKKL